MLECPVVDAVVFVTLVACGVLSGLAVTRKRRRIAASRNESGNRGRSQFLEYCSERGLSQEVAEQIYGYFQGWVFDGFPVGLEDELGAFFGIEGEDIFETARDVAVICRAELRPGSLETLTRNCSVRDVIDVVTTGRGSREQGASGG